MNQFLTNVVANLGYEKLLQLHYEMILSNQQVAQTAALICLLVQKWN
jgi:hypothetical protein